MTVQKGTLARTKRPNSEAIADHTSARESRVETDLGIVGSHPGRRRSDGAVMNMLQSSNSVCLSRGACRGPRLPLRCAAARTRVPARCRAASEEGASAAGANDAVNVLLFKAALDEAVQGKRLALGAAAFSSPLFLLAQARRYSCMSVAQRALRPLGLGPAAVAASEHALKFSGLWQEAIAKDGELGILEGRTGALIHPAIMGFLFAASLWTGYLGLQWKRVNACYIPASYFQRPAVSAMQATCIEML